MPGAIPFEQRVQRDKEIIHYSVTLPQRIEQAQQAEQPQPGPMPGQPQPGMGQEEGMPQQPGGPPSPLQPGMGGPMAQPGMPFTGNAPPGQFGLPPMDPQGMLSNAEQLQQMQQRYAQPAGQ